MHGGFKWNPPNVTLKCKELGKAKKKVLVKLLAADWLATKAQMGLIGTSLPACAAASVWQVYGHCEGSLIVQ